MDKLSEAERKAFEDACREWRETDDYETEKVAFELCEHTFAAGIACERRRAAQVCRDVAELSDGFITHATALACAEEIERGQP